VYLQRENMQHRQQDRTGQRIRDSQIALFSFYLNLCVTGTKTPLNDDLGVWVHIIWLSVFFPKIIALS